MSLNKTSHNLNLCNLCGQSFHPNFIHKHLQSCTGASTFVPRNRFFSHPLDQPSALAPACLTTVSDALYTSSASSVNNKDSQYEHEPPFTKHHLGVPNSCNDWENLLETMTVGKQMDSSHMESSSTNASVGKPSHDAAFYDDEINDSAAADAMIDDDDDGFCCAIKNHRKTMICKKE
jgi:hypothetical protein